MLVIVENELEGRLFIGVYKMKLGSFHSSINKVKVYEDL
jgi:hypothetical protein